MGAAFVTKRMTSAPEDTNLHAESANQMHRDRRVVFLTALLMLSQDLRQIRKNMG